MKKILYIAIIVFFFSNCSSLNHKSEKEKIIYVVPDTVQNWFSNVIKSPSLANKDKIYFIISRKEMDNRIVYNLALCNLDSYILSDKYFIENTNRYLYVNKELYPLLVDMDQIFSVRDYRNEDLLEKLNNKRNVALPSTIIYEKTYWVIFENKWGDIIQTSDEATRGYGTNSPNKTDKNL